MVGGLSCHGLCCKSPAMALPQDRPALDQRPVGRQSGSCFVVNSSREPGSGSASRLAQIAKSLTEADYSRNVTMAEAFGCGPGLGRGLRPILQDPEKQPQVPFEFAQGRLSASHRVARGDIPFLGPGQAQRCILPGWSGEDAGEAACGVTDGDQTQARGIRGLAWLNPPILLRFSARLNRLRKKAWTRGSSSIGFVGAEARR